MSVIASSLLTIVEDYATIVTMTDELLTTEEVCARLKVHLNTLYHYIDTGQLKALRMGGLWRIKESDLDAFLSNGHKGSGDEAVKPT